MLYLDPISLMLIVMIGAIAAFRFFARDMSYSLHRASTAGMAVGGLLLALNKLY